MAPKNKRIEKIETLNNKIDQNHSDVVKRIDFIGGRIDKLEKVVDNNKRTEPQEMLLQMVVDSGLRRRVPKRWREIMNEHLKSNI